MFILPYGLEDETFSFSSLYPLYLASCKYIVSLLYEMRLVYGTDWALALLKSESCFDRLIEFCSIIMDRTIMTRNYFGQHCLKFISVTTLKLAKQILQVYILAYHVFDQILYIHFILFNSYKLFSSGVHRGGNMNRLPNETSLSLIFHMYSN